jgi:hypothetical protein
VADALKNGHLRGYGGDVWFPQPAPKDHPLRYATNPWGGGNAMVPHMSGTSIDAQKVCLSLLLLWLWTCDTNATRSATPPAQRPSWTRTGLAATTTGPRTSLCTGATTRPRRTVSAPRNKRFVFERFCTNFLDRFPGETWAPPGLCINQYIPLHSNECLVLMMMMMRD